MRGNCYDLGLGVAVNVCASGRGSIRAGYYEPSRLRSSGPTSSRTVLFGELLDHCLKVWITGAEAPSEPVSTALGNPFAVRYHVELASLARCTDSFNV